ncbi:unnamed protein product [Gemmata massiliana]|uniref:Uncharacterized protein n=1 Tax=Gemmata massiliana TaxID=1210884 RepID=A0A6P2DD52_9BACT|nr:hypothetical protein [Gemmata massiliana]VTR99267.1 unnamed protein product [Gemmata massiliana]
MLRASLFVTIALVLNSARAADLPPPMPEAERAVLVSKWRKGYDAALAKVKDEIAEAKVLSKDIASAGEGKIMLMRANTRLAVMTKSPELYGGGFTTVFEGAKGQVGRLAQSSLTVAEVNTEGTVVEGVAIRRPANPFVVGEEKVTVRYLVVSSLPDAKKGATVSLNGLWYVAGDMEHNGKKIPVLYRFEIKKDEMPAKE